MFVVSAHLQARCAPCAEEKGKKTGGLRGLLLPHHVTMNNIPLLFVKLKGEAL